VNAANDPHVDYKALVRDAYDRLAPAYDQSRGSDPDGELDSLITHLADRASVLDVGCGVGVPNARDLVRRFSVTGVDSSREMVRLARANVPEGSFVHADVMSVELPPSSFDAAIAFYSVFHLPRLEQPELFRRIHGWLKPGGYFLCTLSRRNEDAYTEDDFFGGTMFWDNFGLEEYERILEQAGFSVLESTVIGGGFSGAYEAPAERFPLLLTQKQPVG
jgi:SAM-dependent methyltransferase